MSRSEIDNKNLNCSVFLDIKKAFDSVSHKILLKKLYRYGFRGKIFEILTSYLKNRTQTVTIQESTSDPLPFECGVPQGSVLGPLLFILFLNDLPSASDMKTLLFADDACLTLSGPSPPNIESKVNNELSKVNNWFKFNKLTLNLSKTFFMIFSKRNMEYKFNLKMDNINLTQTNSVKYLGVYFDDRLNWSVHLDKLKRKISKGAWAVSKLRDFVNTKTLIMVYNSLTNSQLNYCNLAWGFAPKQYLNKVFLIQKRTLRIMTFSHYQAHSTPLFSKLKILKLDDTIQLKVAITAYNYLNSPFQENIYNIFSTSMPTPLNLIHSHNTRSLSKNNLYHPFARTRLGQSSLEYQIPIIWNQIATDIRNSQTSKIFKQKYKKHLLDSYDQI